MHVCLLLLLLGGGGGGGGGEAEGGGAGAGCTDLESGEELTDWERFQTKDGGSVLHMGRSVVAFRFILDTRRSRSSSTW